MAGTSPTVGNSFVRQLPTPSPYSFSVTSSGHGSRLQIERLSLSLRFLALVLGFVSAVTLTTRLGKRAGSLSSFTDSSELVYCLIVSIVTFVYSALQLFKGVCDLSYGAILIPDRISDYLSFVLDQVIQQTESTPSLQRAAIVSVTMSFAAFSVMAACTPLSGYKLCKRIIW